ncbi:hypothetical protein L198_00137 [Cryptococcus wingfieldii CBS 7118]|uniref:LIM zinc-binding domain-containing protein n=1 Tax=Cryptococcus wingfieldii CBS 7118 TaxID=1295528 RepID=A0A1E3K795_9TREE|nr:hypothetical protein L198_00137 [Cryptococcus wingfieldii CBS 7118]ODO08407.1 hypothetical protein L198_00137 [Cryptococcus wingfieldii CBS 7118]
MQPNGHPAYYQYPQSSISSSSSLPPQSPYSPYPPQSPYAAGELGQIPHSGSPYGSVPSSTSSRSSYGAPPPIPSHSYPSNSYPNPHPYSYSNRIPSVEAVPSPVPKVAYEAPVFQTFQERKRAKDAALRAKASQGDLRAGRGAMPPPPIPQNLPPVPQIPQAAYSVPPSTMRGPSPGPEAMAMMAKPGGMGPPPVPPTRSRSPAPSPSNSVPPIPVSSQGGRPLPSPRGRTPLSVNTSPASGGRALPSSPVPHTAPSQTPSPHPYASAQPSPTISTPSQQQPDLDRSDTLSSVKSLDRASFSSSPSSASRRPLPKPPGGVVASKSLDRGTPSLGDMGEAYRKGRRQPSTVNEESEPEDELANGMRAMGIQANGGSRSPSPQPPAIVVPTISAPSESSDPHAPAKFTPLPSFSFSDSDASSAASEDESNHVTPKAERTSKKEDPDAAISFAGAPMITVSSSDTADEPAGEISFAVPSISVGGAPALSVPVPSISTPHSHSHSHQHPNDTRTRVQSSSAILCTGCGQPIIGRIVNAMNQRWHPQCFMCAECGELLEHVSSYEFEGKAYCHLDYHDKFAHHCHHCKTPIVEPRFITLNDDVLGQRYYHELHFFCSECGDPFLDPSKSSAPGTEKARANGDDEGDDGETSDFVIHKGHPYCENCHVRLHKPKCKGCRKPIRDMAVGALGGKWHKECFVCTNCKGEFGNGLFFPHQGGAFCTTCYQETMVGA